MSLTLYFHPLSSYCHKALVALYENGVSFEKHVVKLMDPDEAAAFTDIVVDAAGPSPIPRGFREGSAAIPSAPRNILPGRRRAECG